VYRSGSGTGETPPGAAAIVFPAEDVRVHPKNIVEIISAEMLKDALNLKDGDWVTLTVDRLLKVT